MNAKENSRTTNILKPKRYSLFLDPFPFSENFFRVSEFPSWLACGGVCCTNSIFSEFAFFSTLWAKLSDFWILDLVDQHYSIYNRRGKFPTLLWYIYTCTYFKFLGLCFSYILSSSSFYLINWIKIGLGSRRMKENYSFLSWFHTGLLSCLQENSNESTFCNLVLSFWQV